MKRRLIALLACLVILGNGVFVGIAHAQPLTAFSFPPLFSAETVEDATQNLLKKFETEILPKFETILTPEQREKFKTAVVDGTSFRKAFKSLTLTPEQKTQLGTLLKSLPKKDLFASLTPDQKKQFFLKKKELFMPTPEEIGEKISEKMKMAKENSPFAPSGADIGAKISEKMKAAKSKLEEMAP